MFAYRFLLDIPENYWAFSKNLESGTSQWLALPLMLQTNYRFKVIMRQAVKQEL